MNLSKTFKLLNMDCTTCAHRGLSLRKLTSNQLNCFKYNIDIDLRRSYPSSNIEDNMLDDIIKLQQATNVDDSCSEYQYGYFNLNTTINNLRISSDFTYKITSHIIINGLLL